MSKTKSIYAGLIAVALLGASLTANAKEFSFCKHSKEVCAIDVNPFSWASGARAVCEYLSDQVCEAEKNSSASVSDSVLKEQLEYMRHKKENEWKKG